MLQFLTETGGFKNIPAFCGSLIYERPDTPAITLGLMMQKVSSKSDSWAATGDDLNDFLFMFVDKLFGIRDDVLVYRWPYEYARNDVTDERSECKPNRAQHT